MTQQPTDTSAGSIPVVSMGERSTSSAGNASADSAENTPALSGLVDTNKVIELEYIDPATLPNKAFYRAVKRAFDTCSCIVALIILAIPMLIVGIAIKLDSPGPVFYKQQRLGRAGRPFTIVKFRSMVEDAEAQGAQWAAYNDPRITRVGKHIRNTHFDEVPQFFNVIKGDMSLIGPRPERPEFYDEFERYIHGFRQRMLVKPGVSGLSQTNGGYNLLPEEKVLYDFEYIKKRGFMLDTQIILKTLKIVFTYEGAR